MKLVVFLDIDDVIATGDVWTSSWVILSFRLGGQPFLEHEWDTVFQPEACRFLQALHDSISPEYVISSSWSNCLTRDNMQEFFEKTGLGFVSSNLHDDWTTVKAEICGIQHVLMKPLGSTVLLNILKTEQARRVACTR